MKSTSLSFILFLITFSVFSQPLHISPFYKSDYGRDSTLLSIDIKVDTIRSLVIENNTFYINYDNGNVDMFPLINKTVIDLCNSINIKHKNELQLSTNYPSVKADRLSEVIIEDLSSKTDTIIKFDKQRPTLSIDFGVLFSLAENESSLENNFLLNQSGFNLELIANHKFKMNKNDGLYTTARLGFASNLNVLVTDSTNIENPGNQIEAAIRQANHAALSGNVEYSFKATEAMEIGIYGETGINYFRLNPIDIGGRFLSLSDTLIKVEDAISESTIAQFKLQSTRAFPIGYGEIGANFKFIKNEKMIAYAGIGFGTRPNIVRGIRYKLINNNTEFDKNFMNYFIKVENHQAFLRPKIGLSLANLIDIKAEAVIVLGDGGIDRNSRNNLFRILITKDFPIMK